MADIVSVIAQRNHAVICDLYHGFNFLSQVLVRDLGPFERNFDLAIRYTGDALQKFTELGFAVDGDAKQFPEMKNLAEVLGEKFKVFPDFTSDWLSDRDSASRYRNYLTHQGRFYRVRLGEDVLILSRTALKNRVPQTWTHADRDFEADPTRFVTLQDAAVDVMGATISTRPRLRTASAGT